MPKKKKEHTAKEAADIPIRGNGTTLGRFLGAFLKLPAMPNEKPAARKIGQEEKAGAEVEEGVRLTGKCV